MKNKFTTTIILVLIFNAAAIAGWFYFFSAISVKNKEIAEIRGKIYRNDKISENNRRLEETVARLAAENEKTDSVFLNNQNIVKFIESIEDVSRQGGVLLRIENLNLDGKNNIKPSARFSITGKFEKVFYSLVLFENLQYAIDIKKMTLAKSSNKEWVAGFDVVLNNFFEPSFLPKQKIKS